jgi:hypothetical protein
MAQADSVPSSSRQLITGDSANQSTNLRAAVRIRPVDRHDFIGGLDAPVITDTSSKQLVPSKSQGRLR